MPVHRAFLAFLAAFAVCANARSQSERMPVVRVAPRTGGDRSSPGDWPKYCGNLAMTGEASGETAIRKATASALSPLWVAQLAGSVASSPTVVSGTVYVGDWAGFESALDAATGSVKALANLGRTSAVQCVPAILGVTSAPAVSGDVVYVAGGDDAFYALDAQSLGVLWRRPLGDNSAQGGYYGWSSPAVLGGRVLQGVSSNCDDPFVPGQLVALDETTGGLIDQVYTVPIADPGGGIWTSPAVDLESGKIFVTTASATHFGDGDAYGILRLSLGDLAVEDLWTIPPDPVIDSDWGSSPTLFRDASGRRLVGAGQKNGGYYVFLQRGLAAGPVWIAKLAVGGNCPQCGNGVTSTAAFDGRRLYVGTGTPPDWTGPGPVGAVVALDPATGATLWRHIFAGGAVLAPVSVANGVVFAAGGQTVAALDAETGEILWHYEGASPFYGGIAISRGRIYFGDVGGRVYAYGVPGVSNP